MTNVAENMTNVINGGGVNRLIFVVVLVKEHSLTHTIQF